MTTDGDFRKKAVHSIIWAAAQNWGSKFLTFIIFIALARLLTPTEFGTAAAGLLFLTLLAFVAEFGFGEAVIQKRDLVDEDINLPFFVSMALSVILAVVTAWQADAIEKLMGVEGLAPVVVAVAILAPFTTACMFQEALYKRHTLFKRLAFRTLSGTLLGGLAACGVAYAGFGVWALIAQMYVTTFVNLAWLWSRPVWKPTWRHNPLSFVSLLRYGAPVFGTRMLDFAAIRTADFIIVTAFGTATLGLYSAGTKLFQVIMYLLQSVFSDVGLTILTKIAHDRARLAALYLNTASTSVAIISPIFVMLAALAPEIGHVLFGEKWASIDLIIMPFFLLGAIQCAQFLNGSYYGAVGKPIFMFYFNLLKLVAQIPVFLFCRDGDVIAFVSWFCVAQTAATLPSYYFVCKLLGINIKDLIGRVWPFIVSSLVTFIIVYCLHNDISMLITHEFVRGIIIGIMFACIYGVCLAVMAREQIKPIFQFIKRRHVPESHI